MRMAALRTLKCRLPGRNLGRCADFFPHTVGMPGGLLRVPGKMKIRL
jgi:hypothetical protein